MCAGSAFRSKTDEGHEMFRGPSPANGRSFFVFPVSAPGAFAEEHFPWPYPDGVVFRSRYLFKGVKPALLFKPVVNAHPRALALYIHFALAVGNPAARAVQQALGAFGMRAYAAGRVKHALAAKRAPFEEPAHALDRGEEKRIKRREHWLGLLDRIGDRPHARAASKHKDRFSLPELRLIPVVLQDELPVAGLLRKGGADDLYPVLFKDGGHLFKFLFTARGALLGARVASEKVDRLFALERGEDSFYVLFLRDYHEGILSITAYRFNWLLKKLHMLGVEERGMRRTLFVRRNYKLLSQQRKLT